MKIIIIGLGKVGLAIARQMAGEEHDLVLVDRSGEAIAHAEAIDAMCIEGNGAGASTLLRAGVREADLVIAVTANDEVNLMCCLMAKKLGARHTVARVRNPEYSRDAAILRHEIGLDLIINPEQTAAQEIARILRVPDAFSVESLARGSVELIGFQIAEGDSLVGQSLYDYNHKHPNTFLLCAAMRGEEVIIPNGRFVPQVGDRVYAISTANEMPRIFRSMGRNTAPVRKVSVLGGGRIAVYLAWALEPLGTRLVIVEQDEAKCLSLAEQLPKATVLHGDGTNSELLETEGVFSADAFVALTGRDEENLLMAVAAKRAGVAKALPKMSRPNYIELVHTMGVNTAIVPQEVIASNISSYVRGLANSQGSAVESLHRILGGAIEAVEFTAGRGVHFLDKPLRELRFRPDLLVAAIVHDGKLTIPDGSAMIREGDHVIVIARQLFLQDLNDVLEV